MILEVGIRAERRMGVDRAATARSMGSGELAVLATPALVALMEKTAWESVAPYLADGCGTVGSRMDIRHLAPTPVGMEVVCTSELVEMEGRRLVFHIAAHDAAGVVAEAEHERFIIDNARFMAKAEKRTR